jgi:hypothetical protein
VGCEYLEQVGVHERFTAEDSKVAVAVFLRVVDESVQILFADHLSRGSDVHPTTLAAKLAAVDDRDEQKGRKVDPLFEAFFVFLNRSHAFEAEIVSELPEKSLIDFVEHAVGESSDHRTMLRWAVLRGIEIRVRKFRRVLGLGG